MPSTDTNPELTAKASMAQPVSQPAVYANGLIVDNCVKRLFFFTGVECFSWEYGVWISSNR
jgi:hypothetical protein